MKRRLIAGTINRYPADEGWEHVHLDKSGRPLYDLEHRRFGDPAEIVADFTELIDDEHLELASSFDEVRCWQALEHLTPKAAPIALAGFRRVLRPGGVLDVEVPNVEAVVIAWMASELTRDEALANIYGSATKLADDHLNAHRWGYTPASLIELLHTSGFRKLEVLQDDSPVVAPLRVRAVSP